MICALKDATGNDGSLECAEDELRLRSPQAGDIIVPRESAPDRCESDVQWYSGRR